MRAGTSHALLAAVLLSACTPADGSLPDVTTSEDGGTRIVENRGSGWATADAWSVSAEPLVTIGVLDGAPEHQLFGVASAARQSDGTIVVVDESRSVRQYDREGAFVRAFGRGGDGPGEFRYPTQVLVTAGDSISIWDANAYRLTRFGPAGELASIATLDYAQLSIAVAPPLYPGEGYLLSDGRIVIRLVEKPGAGPRTAVKLLTRAPEYPDEDVFRLGNGALVVTPDLSSIDTLAFFGGQDQALLPPPLGIPVVPAQAKNTTIVAGPDAVGICVGEQDEPEVTCFRSDGAQTIRWAAVPEPVTKGDFDTWVDAIAEEWGAKMATSEAEKLLAEVPTPEFRPEYTDLHVDRAGNLWVERRRRDASTFTVFDSEGALLGAVDLPAIRVLEIGDDYVIGIHRDELEVEYLHVYGLRK